MKISKLTIFEGPVHEFFKFRQISVSLAQGEIRKIFVIVGF